MPTPTPSSPVIVYWRPGCGYCARLRHGLRRSGLVTTEVNIWDHPEAAATVRRIAGGNETVPTVVVGEIGLINPTVSKVLEAVAAVAPEHLAGVEPAAGTGRGSAPLRWAVVGSLIVASFSVDALGHPGLSWALDGVALVTFLVLRFGFR